MCERYATQAELKSVPLKIISSMSVVPDRVSETVGTDHYLEKYTGRGRAVAWVAKLRELPRIRTGALRLLPCRS